MNSLVQKHQQAFTISAIKLSKRVDQGNRFEF